MCGSYGSLKKRHRNLVSPANNRLGEKISYAAFLPSMNIRNSNHLPNFFHCGIIHFL